MTEAVSAAVLVLVAAGTCWVILRLAAGWWRSASDVWPVVRRLRARQQGAGLGPNRAAGLLLQVGVVIGAAAAIAVAGNAVLPTLVAVHLVLVLCSARRWAATPMLTVQLLWLAWCANWSGTSLWFAPVAALAGGLLCCAGQELVLGRGWARRSRLG